MTAKTRSYKWYYLMARTSNLEGFGDEEEREGKKKGIRSTSEQNGARTALFTRGETASQGKQYMWGAGLLSYEEGGKGTSA